MTPPKRLNLQGKLSARRNQKRLRQLAAIAIVLLLLSWLVRGTAMVQLNANRPVDAIFVLGGSVQREIRAAQLSAAFPGAKILISQGSKDPCIFHIFQQQRASAEQVWLEQCADSTFGNFVFSIPILQRWGVHKVILVTSKRHLPRAKLMGQILLGAQGIAMELEVVREKGRPGNQESRWKTVLDVGRSLLWAPISQIIGLPCFKVVPLQDFNPQAWPAQSYECEGPYELSKPKRRQKNPQRPAFQQT